ncbi:MAG: hypothetical protein KIT16_19080, partial [Rhodospirillaceae bacterium]|nr:hypothetical protein [Rhodospirillaceae bacterium]
MALIRDVPPDRTAKAIAAIVCACVARPWLVILGWLLASIAAGGYAADHIAINADPLSMLSARLSFRQDFEAFKKAFPALTDTVAIVVDGKDEARVAAAADAVHANLAAKAGHFDGIFYPEGDPFFRRNGLLYSSLAEVQALSARLSEAQPMLATLARDPSLRGLADLLKLGIEALGTADGQPAQISKAIDSVAQSIEASNEGRRLAMPWRKLLDGSPSVSVNRRFIIVRPRLDFASMAPAGAALDDIRAAIRAAAPGDGVRIRLTGSAAIHARQ